MEPMSPDLENQPSLQNGWRLYNNYCLGCHSLKYQRYERTADDLGVPHEIVLEKLVFQDQKIGELMTTSMDPPGCEELVRRATSGSDHGRPGSRYRLAV